MTSKTLVYLCFLAFSLFPAKEGYTLDKFIATNRDLIPYLNCKNALIVASSGRSGSSMLVAALEDGAPHLKILKSHRLPPNKRYKGKIIFIFSNPDQAAESALHMFLTNAQFGHLHMRHMETSDLQWYRKIKRKQTVKNNLLAYDGLGCEKQLDSWLNTRTRKTDESHARILAIKYENLWDIETLEKIRNFIGVPSFTLPPKRTRGYKSENLMSEEVVIRNTYNYGTQETPKYQAYNKARIIWEIAPPYQFLDLID